MGAALDRSARATDSTDKDDASPVQTSSSRTLSNQDESRQTISSRVKKTLARRRSLPNNGLLKRLDALYWQRLSRYFYVRFLRMSSSPEAIARGVAAGIFAGSFPLMGLQIIIGVAIAVMVRGNKAIAAASTWISNPLTYGPLFLLNFHVGRWLLRQPVTTDLPISSSSWSWDALTSMGLSVVGSLMVGSLVVGLVASFVGYFVGLAIARRVQRAKHR
ncbi:MAG: DUF2062 domain-containing protein [Leptolyngbya foveolarum]|uniref:DUF2062 domain-containing protein n=1 Tax=Leptolyngbya foveolarum TaxID=47253 RepID=A0A2W4UKH7_9CYAN|nr:MAG: DUF2062 domain-containing protein [Leptolyngbya foveolarum]